MELTNIASERAVLAGICRYGLDTYLEVEALLEEDTFSVDYNKVLYKCLAQILSQTDKVDFVSILSAGHSLLLGEYLNKQEVLKHIHGILETPIDENSIKLHAQKIRRLQFGRHLQGTIKESWKNLAAISGEETISEIMGLVETPIQDASLIYTKQDNFRPKGVGEDIDVYIEYLMSDEKPSIGLPTGFPSYDSAIGGGLRRKCIDLVAARSKAQPLTSNILTPTGWVKMGDLKIGDRICHPSGSISTVTDILNRSKKEVYKFSFSDRTEVEACEDHLWKIKSWRWNHYKILSLKDIKKLGMEEVCRKTKWQVPAVEKCEFGNNEHFIHPYIMGVLLGDGCLIYDVSFTSGDEQIVGEVEKRLPKQFKLTVRNKQGTDAKNYSLVNFKRGFTSGGLNINFIKEEIKKLELLGKNSHQKFIPKQYLFSSIEDRIELLQGLFDTDGSVSKKDGSIEYTTVSEDLKNDICFLINSLGGKTMVQYRQTSYCKEKTFWSYRVKICFNDGEKLFKLDRKKKLCKKRKKPDWKKNIVSIESVGIKEVQCITIDNPDGLYITDGFNITHNCGKSLLGQTIAINLAGKLQIPVLILDTEMSEEDNRNRMLANLSGVPINEIASGRFRRNEKDKQAVLGAAEQLKQVRCKHINITGKPFPEMLAIARRWILKDVGFQPNGRTNDCLIIYDYLKLTSAEGISNALAEHQVLGFQMIQLHNFVVEHDCSCLCFVQLNRDGITKETIDTIAGSDRLVWVATSISIFKEKSAEEISDDGPNNGNKKIVPLVARHGPGMEDGGYICCQMNGDVARIREIGPVRINRRDFPQRDPDFEGEDEGEDS